VDKINASTQNSTLFEEVRSFRETKIPTDSQLVAEARRGDASAFGELYQRHRSGILRVAERITRDSRDAQDAVQDAMLSAYVGLSTFNGQSKIQTWLTRIAINSSLMVLRKRRTRRNLPKFTVSLEKLNEAGWQVADAALDPEKALLMRERQRLVRKSIQALPVKLRTVAELSHVHQRSAREIAVVLGISVPTAKARLFRANSVLKRSGSLRRVACAWWSSQGRNRLQLSATFKTFAREAKGGSGTFGV
jgi:RNA polymerase sigma factor (sigma-70 family)